jgi:23S rRNA pseudouridine1911/1915/1917 synthase
MKKRIFRRWANDPVDLRDLIVARLGLTADEATDLIVRGSVYIGHERTTESRKVADGERLTIHLTLTLEAPPLAILHRDDDVAVIDKPAGLPSQAEPGQRAFSVEAAIARDLGRDARLMHRLDKDASGVMLVALRSASYAPLQHALAAGDIDRRYVALSVGELRGDGAIKLRIARHPRDRRLRTALPEHAPAGDVACTRYRVVGHGALAGAPLSAISVELETGRTHQIRVHLSAIGHPILGDTAYGGPAFERLCLHASALELPHPATGRPLRIRADLPETFARLVPGLTSPFA